MGEQLHPLLADMFGCAELMALTAPGRARALDAMVDACLAATLRGEQLGHILSAPRRNVLAIIPSLPATASRVALISRNLKASRHAVSLIVDDRADVWRQTKINAAVRSAQVGGGLPDWLVVADDDVALPERFLDLFIGAAELAGFDLCQPAHRFHSFAGYTLTQRWPGSIARQTRFVEIGPVFAMRRALIEALFPAPETEGGWCIDMIWADLAQRRGWNLGVVDCCPLQHLRMTHQLASRRLEASRLLHNYDPKITRQQLFSGDRVVIPLPSWLPSR